MQTTRTATHQKVKSAEQKEARNESEAGRWNVSDDLEAKRRLVGQDALPKRPVLPQVPVRRRVRDSSAVVPVDC